MKDKLFGVFAVMAFAGTIVAAQDPQPPAPSPSPSPMAVPQSPSRAPSVAQPEDQSLTGCLVQGSGPTVFLLENAKIVADVGSVGVSHPIGEAAQSDRSVPSTENSKGRTYVLTTGASSIDLKGQLNHQVTVTGMGAKTVSSAPASAQTTQASEKDLPRFAAKKIVKIADTCSSAG